MSEIDWREFSRVFDFYASEEQAPMLHDFYFWVNDQLDENDDDPEMILELGCGTGFLASKLVDWYPESNFQMVDFDPHMLAAARERFADDSNVEIHEVRGEEYLANVASNSIDAIVSCRSFYTLAEPATVATNMIRALKPGGRIMIYDFQQSVDLAALDAQEQDPEHWPTLRSAIEDFNAGISVGTYHVYSEAEIRNLFEGAGGEVVVYEDIRPVAPSHRFCVQRA